MIFGITAQERDRRRMARFRAISDEGWVDWYAWFPVRLEDKRVAWLERVQRQRSVIRQYYEWPSFLPMPTEKSYRMLPKCEIKDA